MPITVPQSPARLRIMQTIRNAGPSGLTRQQVAQITGLPTKTVAMFMRNITAAADIFAGLRTADTGRFHPYIAAEHYAAYCAAHGLPDPCIAPREQPAPTPPRRGHSTTPAKRTPTPLPPFGSPYRAQIIKALDAAAEPLLTHRLAEAAAVSIASTRRVLDALLREGRVANVGGRNRSLWQKATPGQRQSTASSHMPARLCNSNRPNMTPNDLPRMTIARADATQHLQAPSRRAEGPQPYTPPMIIGSGIGGGMR